MRNWRLRTKLLAVLLIPALAALALGALRVVADYERTHSLMQSSQQIELDASAARVVQELQRERDLTVAYISGGRTGDRSELDKQRAAVDSSIQQFRSEIEQARQDGGGNVVDRFADAAAQLDRIQALRLVTDTTRYPAEAALRAYTASVENLLRLGEQGITRTDNPELVRLYLATNAIARAKEQESIKRALLASALSADQFGVGDQRALLAADAELESALKDFRKWATPAQVQIYNDTVTGLTVDRAHTIEETAVVSAQTGGSLAGLSKQEWLRSSTETVNLTQQVAQQLRDQLGAKVSQLESAARTEMYIAAALVLAALILAFAIALMIARSLLLPLRTLRRSALDVADNRLPEAVESILDEDNPDGTARSRIEPIPVHTTEEIGRVARSFDAVHSQALRLASEQALLRNNVNDLFVNLARRSQTLVQRQLSLIDRLEQDEQDPDQLSQLFELDHLATRMRRNNENLLILGGTDLTRKTMRPVPLPEVAGAAVSEVEQYARVSIADPPELAVQGRVVNDVVHLIAELLENATVFSNPDTEVTVRTAYRRQELVLEIRDRGVGIDAGELAEINDRLVRPPDVDVAVSRRMGLFVVGQLARRHNIGVELQNNADLEGGVTATVRLSGELIVQLTPNGPMPMPDVPRSGPDERDPLTETGSHAGLAAAFGGGSMSAGALNGSSPDDRALPEPPTERAVPVNGQHYAGQVNQAQTGSDHAGHDSADATDGSDSQATSYSVQVASGDAYGATDVPHWDAEEDLSGTGGGPADEWPRQDVTTGDQPEVYEGQCGAPPGLDDPGGLFHNPLEDEKTAQFEQPPGDGAAVADDMPGVLGGPAPMSSGAPGDEEPAAQTQSKGPARDMDDAPTERLPIYEAVLSQWFRAADTEEEGQAGPSALDPAPDLEVDDPLAPSSEWGSRNGYGAPAQNGVGSHGTAAGAVGGRERARREAQSQQFQAEQDAGFAEEGAASDHEASSEPASTEAAPQGLDDSGEQRDPGWGAGDAGWQAAEALVENTKQEQEITPAGLPKRKPKSNLVPGSAAKPQSPAPAKPAAPRSADAVRGRMSNFQQGVQRGRHAKVEPESDPTEQSRSIPSRHEEQE